MKYAHAEEKLTGTFLLINCYFLFTCPWRPGVMKQFWAILAHVVESYRTSICRFEGVSSVGCIPRSLLRPPNVGAHTQHNFYCIF